jgi:energy-converting hydrogenase Eha subunit C
MFVGNCGIVGILVSSNYGDVYIVVGVARNVETII